ncbi:hypothetical protein F5B21DRAFT_216206 [Xylaria acuta]|nr:hypothetical protein F5B21DRAFT_216206 [Xylaria acuta]
MAMLGFLSHSEQGQHTPLFVIGPISTHKRPENLQVMEGKTRNPQRQKAQAVDVNFVSAKRIWDTLRKMLFDVVELPSRYLTDQDLKRLNIECTSIDLGTGKPTDGAERFIYPFPAAQIRKLLERSKLWA